MDIKAEKCIWSHAEIVVLLEIIKENNIIEQMDKKTVRHDHLFKIVCEELKQRNIFKTPEQARLKFKVLKQQFNSDLIKTKKSGSGAPKFKYFEAFQDMMSKRPRANIDHGIDLLECVNIQDVVECDLNAERNAERGNEHKEQNDDENTDSSVLSTSSSSTLLTGSGTGRNKGRRTYESALRMFASEIKKTQVESQKTFFEQQNQLLEEQRKLENEIQDREDARMRSFLSGLNAVFNKNDDLDIIEYCP